MLRMEFEKLIIIMIGLSDCGRNHNDTEYYVTFEVPSFNAAEASLPGPSTVTPSSSGPQLALTAP